MNGAALLQFAGKYLEHELQDLVLFCMSAVKLQGLPTDEESLERLLGQAKRWVLKHGTPNEEKVREFLAGGQVK